VIYYNFVIDCFAKSLLEKIWAVAFLVKLML